MSRTKAYDRQKREDANYVDIPVSADIRMLLA